MNKDSHKIFETYCSSNQLNENTALNEGLFDRLKARGSQAVGGVKGLGQQIAGKAQQAVGKAVGKASNFVGGGPEGDTIAKNIQSKGEKREFGGKMAGDVAKYSSYIKNTVATTIKDLKALNMPVDDEVSLAADLKSAIVKHLKGVSKGQLTAKAGTKVAGKGVGGKFAGKVT